MDKLIVRKHLLEIRENLEKSEIEKNSELIFKQLKPLINSYENIGIYLDFNNEVLVTKYLDYFLNNFKIVCTSKIVDNELIFYQIKDHKFILNQFEIKEPISDIVVNKKKINVLVIPLLGFDDKLNRIGFGKGFYDRYLEDFKGLKIGLAFEAQKLNIIPTDNYDVKLDLIITEKQVYK